MNRTVTFLCLLTFLLGASSCTRGVVRRNKKGTRIQKNQNPSFVSGIRKKVALLTFFNEAPYGGEDLGVTATEEYRKELSRTGEFVIDVMGKKLFGSSKEVYSGGGVKLVQLSRKAKVSGLNFVVFGRVIEARVREKVDEIGIIRETRSFSEAKVEVRIFNVNSNKEVFTKILRGFADDSTYRLFVSDRETRLSYRRDLLRYAVKVAVRKSIPSIVDIAAKMDWVGRVAKIMGNKIYVNAGRKSGMNIGDILKVITEGTEIYDPETNAMIGVSKGEVKGTIEIIDYFGPDGSIAVLHSGGSVQEGDYVQLY